MARTPFPLDPQLTGLVLAYTNRALIADQVLPRVPVGKQEFRWLNYARLERFTVPETYVGRKGAVNETEFTANEAPGMTHDHGLDDVVPNDDITQAPAGYNPLGNAAEGLTELIALDRELRVAGVVFNPSTYPTGNKETLTTGGYLNDPDVDAGEILLDAIETPLMRPNIAVISQRVWNKIRGNLKLVQAIRGTNQGAGKVRAQELADYLEIDQIYVGGAMVNRANPGQTGSLSRVWGNGIAFLHQNRLANTQRGITFGYTAEYGTRVAGQMSEPKVGLRGGVRVRVGESVGEIIAAPDCGYFIENPVDPAIF